MLILPIKFHPDLSTLSVFQDFRFARFPVSPLELPPPPMSLNLVGILNESSKAQDPSKCQISLRSDKLLISYKYLIFSNFSELLPPPNSTKESGYGPVMSFTYLGLVLILPTKFLPGLSALSIFQDLPQ